MREMLGEMEAAMAFVEQQNTEKITKVKEAWELALKSCLPLFKNPRKFIIEYNPAGWRASRQLAGLRIVSCMGESYLIFEFSTPNSILPFDCFESYEAKQGVIAHEISHVIDDARWNFSFKELIFESNNFITREQRAELMAFVANPLAIYEANKALISSTSKKVGIDLNGYIEPFAAMETLGRIGFERSDDILSFFFDIENKLRVHRILEEYLSSNLFCFAGLVTPPNLNNSKDYGIKTAKHLFLARKEICDYLKNKINRYMLNERLESFGYKIGGSTDHDAWQSVELNNLNGELAKKNLENALKQFSMKHSDWKCFYDLGNVIKQALDRIDF